MPSAVRVSREMPDLRSPHVRRSVRPIYSAPMERARHSQFRAFLRFLRLFKRAVALLARPARTRAQNARPAIPRTRNPFLARRPTCRARRQSRQSPFPLRVEFTLKPPFRERKRGAAAGASKAARESEISLNVTGDEGARAERPFNSRSSRPR